MVGESVGVPAVLVRHMPAGFQPALPAMASGWHVSPTVEDFSRTRGTHVSRLHRLHCQRWHQDGMGPLLGWVDFHAGAGDSGWQISVSSHSRPWHMACCSLTASFRSQQLRVGSTSAGPACTASHGIRMTCLPWTHWGSAICCRVHVQWAARPALPAMASGWRAPQLHLNFVVFIFDVNCAMKHISGSII